MMIRGLFRAGFSLLAVSLVASCLWAADEAADEVRKVRERLRTGEKVTTTRDGLNPCEILRNGIVTRLFEVDPVSIEFRAGSTSHPVCTASWRRADADEIEASSGQMMMDYMKRRMEAQAKGQPFEEKMPVPTARDEVSLTLLEQPSENEAASVAKLESVVEMMKEGVSAEAQGTTVTFRARYDDWVDGVGAKAAWSSSLSQLSVAAGVHLFHVAVRVGDDADENRKQAIEVARRVIDSI